MLAQVKGYNGEPLKLVDYDLARKILSQPDSLSIKEIAMKLNCKTSDVKAVNWHRNQYIKKLGMGDKKREVKETSKPKYTDEQKATAVKLATETSLINAQKVTGVPYQSIQNWIKEIKNTKEKKPRKSLIMSRLRQTYPGIELLNKSLEGKTKREWADENKCDKMMFYYLKKEYKKNC